MSQKYEKCKKVFGVIIHSVLNLNLTGTLSYVMSKNYFRSRKDLSRVVSHDEWEELRREKSNLAETEEKTEN